MPKGETKDMAENDRLVSTRFGMVSNIFLDELALHMPNFTLRFWLWRTGSLPWNLIAFLDEAAERLLLRKVGASYIFIHRLLLDYFASLTPFAF